MTRRNVDEQLLDTAPSRSLHVLADALDVPVVLELNARLNDVPGRLGELVEAIFPRRYIPRRRQAHQFFEGLHLLLARCFEKGFQGV